MTDDETRELFHRVELRLERLDTKMDGLDKRMSSMEGRFDGLESRLAQKADSWVVSLWGMTLAMPIAAAFALTKWL